MHETTPFARPARVRRPARLAAGLALLLAATAGACPRSASIATLEDEFLAVRDLRDAIDVTRYRGARSTPDGVPLQRLLERYSGARARLAQGLAAAAPPDPGEDHRALAAMREALARELVPESEHQANEATAPRAPQCHAAPGAATRAAMSAHLYACFAAAAGALTFEGERLDRLSLFARLATTADAERRQRLWHALDPLWQAVNGANQPSSPYRRLLKLALEDSAGGGTQPGAAVRLIGVDPGAMENWLLRLLSAWRDSRPDEPVEPWDYAWQAGAAARSLDVAIPAGSLRAVNDRYHADLGAPVAALGVRYDLEPRAGKDPVAFTTFGRRPRQVDGGWDPGEPWVFATYRAGGLDNLYELLHETGHAMHIAAIRTRPAFTDWPDSDIFTEGIADIAALEVFDPAWQHRYLGHAASAEDNRTARFAGLVMDIAWALFELRMLREAGADPNAVWTQITHEYLRIEPHPEHSWWAVRGQLVDAPGYMLNYAAGAFLVADLRARARDLWGEPSATWYGRVSEALYRHGLERPAARVIEDFLGRPVSPQALLSELEGPLPP